MQLKTGTILFLPLSRAEWTEAFTEVLSAVNRRIVRTEINKAGDQWRAGGFDVLVVAGIPDTDTAPNLEPLLQMTESQSLAVVSSGQIIQSQLPWLDSIGDVLFWPVHGAELQFRLGRLQSRARAKAGSGDELSTILDAAALIGQTDVFRHALQLLPRILRYDAPVLISGETGTGKDLVARAIHYLGPRKGRPFIPVNCAALPESLFENELFGHVRGAYTTAESARDGIATQADRGTLFLDEVDALSLRTQAGLLRFLQDGHIRPLGAGASKVVDVRLVAATNANLESLVAAGSFRADLFYRLNVLHVMMPPLRQRIEDLPLLADHILRRLSLRYRERVKSLSPATLQNLARKTWRGNVREFENWIHQKYLLTLGDVITDDGVSETAVPSSQHRFGVAKREAIAHFEHRYLSELIAGTNGNISAASRRSGTERRMLSRLMRKHGIDPAAYRRSSATLPGQVHSLTR